MSLPTPVRLALFALLCGGLLPGAAAADSPAPSWIWGTENAATRAPAGLVYFRRVFDLEEPEQGVVEIACDNLYGLFINNERAGAGIEWQQLDRYDITKLLKPGKNCIAVLAENAEDDSAGLVVRVTVQEKGGEPVSHSSGPGWKSSLREQPRWREATFDDSGWQAAYVLGPFGKTAPWGDRVQPAQTKPREVTFTKKVRPAGKFQLLDGDRVLFIGDTLIERAQNSDFLETALTARYPRRNIIFRNLGWSGDTPFGDARAGFGTAADGFKELEQGVYGLRPTVIFVGYGGSASFDGAVGLANFEAGLARLLEMLAVTQAEIILLSPIPHEDLGRPLPDPAQHNNDLKLYAGAIRRIAQERGLRSIDLFSSLSSSAGRERPGKLTDNGIHLNDAGYAVATRAIEQQLEFEPPELSLTLDANGKVLQAAGTRVTDLEARGGKLRFRLLDGQLPEPGGVPHAGAGRRMTIRSLTPGRYLLSADGTTVARGTADEWNSGRSIDQGPEFAQVHKLRQTIVAKNRLYFYRWRPQNETYILGFRKHEQGRNAREIPMYDPLVEELETTIARLRLPVEHIYELVRE